MSVHSVLTQSSRGVADGSVRTPQSQSESKPRQIDFPDEGDPGKDLARKTKQGSLRRMNRSLNRPQPSRKRQPEGEAGVVSPPVNASKGKQPSKKYRKLQVTPELEVRRMVQVMPHGIACFLCCAFRVAGILFTVALLLMHSACHGKQAGRWKTTWLLRAPCTSAENQLQSSLCPDVAASVHSQFFSDAAQPSDQEQCLGEQNRK